MFYQYEIEKTKARERQERIERAQTERLIQSIRPRRTQSIRQPLRGFALALGHLLGAVGGQLVALNSEPQRVRQSNVT